MTTEEYGKATSPLNRLRHGFRSEFLLADYVPVRLEEITWYEALLEDLIEEHQPQSIMEEFWVETVAICLFRLDRSFRSDQGKLVFQQRWASKENLLEQARYSLPEDHYILALVRYEAHVHRQLENALKHLEESRKKREQRPRPEQREPDSFTQRFPHTASTRPPQHLKEALASLADLLVPNEATPPEPPTGEDARQKSPKEQSVSSPTEAPVSETPEPTQSPDAPSVPPVSDHPGPAVHGGSPQNNHQHTRAAVPDEPNLPPPVGVVATHGTPRAPTLSG